MRREKCDYSILTVGQALDVLELFQDHVTELGVLELTQRLGLHKNRVKKLLSTLESRDYLEKNRYTDRYRLGLKNLLLGQTYIHQMGLLQQARTVLEPLVKKCNETTYLAVMKDHHVFYLDAVETSQPVRVVPCVGAKLPVHCTAAGKVLAATATEKFFSIGAVNGDLKKYTNNTITTPAKLKRHLSAVGKLGYAVNNEELEEGVIGIGAPIRDYTKQVVGALSLCGPSMRFDSDRMRRELIPLVLEAAGELSTKLGY